MPISWGAARGVCLGRHIYQSHGVCGIGSTLYGTAIGSTLYGAACAITGMKPRGKAQEEKRTAIVAYIYPNV